MQIVLYYDNQFLAKKIKKQVQTTKVDEIKVLHIDELTCDELKAARHIYVEWGLADFLLKNYWELITDMPIGFYNDSFISDIDDCEDIKKIMESAIENKNWRLCKSINEFLMYGDLIRKRKTLQCFPSKIQIESTDLCNAKCIMCSHAYSPGSGIDLFESGILEKMEAYLPFLRVIVLHGNGEPFIVKKIVDYLNFLRKYNIKFIANTNLSVVSDELLELLEENFIELNVSCDGHDSKLYEAIRDGLSFDVFVNNALKVRSNCPHLYMKLNAVVMRQNIPYLKDIVMFAKNIGFDEVVFNMLCVDKNNNNLSDSPLLYVNEYTESIKNAIKVGEDCGIRVTSFSLESKNSQNDCTSNKRNSGICDWLMEGPYINLHGQVGLCCMNQNIIMGDLRTSTLGDVWNGTEYKKYRELFYNGEIAQSCFGCDFLLQNRLKYITSYSKADCMIDKQERDALKNG